MRWLTGGYGTVEGTSSYFDWLARMAGVVWLDWDQATAAAAAGVAVAVVLAPMVWWAPRGAKPDGSAPALARTDVRVTGSVGHGMIVGNNNTLSATTTMTPTGETIRVGDGAGSRRRHLVRAYEQAGGLAAVGNPRAGAVKIEGGYVQAFDLDHLRSFVIWVPGHGACVVMPETLWDALCAVGDPRGDADVPALAGFPGATGPAATVIGDRALESVRKLGYQSPVRASRRDMSMIDAM